MVKVLGPALSLDASGSLAGVLVFSKWKGRNYIRQLVTPANPQSGGQVGVRAMFKFLTQVWKTGLSAGEKADWEDRADDAVVSPFNAFISYNMRRWRDWNGPSKLDPATESAVIHGLANITSTAGERSVTLSADNNGAGDPWGIIWHRSSTALFTPAWDNVIAVVLSTEAETSTYIDSPLAAGTYYYNQAVFNETGLKATADFEHEATVT